jgi:hypothetical protein
MSRCLPNLGAGSLVHGVALGFQLIDELIELIEIDPGPESERMRNGFWRCALTRFGLLAETGSQCPVDDLLERHTELPRAAFQEACQIIVDSERRAHGSIIAADNFDVKASRSH